MSKIKTAASVHADQEFMTAVATVIGVVVMMAVIVLVSVWIAENGITLPYIPAELA